MVSSVRSSKGEESNTRVAAMSMHAGTRAVENDMAALQLGANSTVAASKVEIARRAAEEAAAILELRQVRELPI